MRLALVLLRAMSVRAARTSTTPRRSHGTKPRGPADTWRGLEHLRDLTGDYPRRGCRRHIGASGTSSESKAAIRWGDVVSQRHSLNALAVLADRKLNVDKTHIPYVRAINSRRQKHINDKGVIAGNIHGIRISARTRTVEQSKIRRVFHYSAVHAQPSVREDESTPVPGFVHGDDRDFRTGVSCAGSG